jgi:tetratricopeptide (TPR) repeat protein
MRSHVALCFISYLLLGPAIGWAQDARQAGPEQPEPWIIDENIPIEQRERARELFHQGTRYLKDGFFDEAAQTYEQALELFDHPGIRYNLAVAQINLKQPIAAYRNILAAMRHGDVPVGKDIYEQARNYRALLETQLAHIDIHCDVPGAEVTLDGKRLFIAPGRYRDIVLAGAHQAVATRDGYIPEARPLVLAPGRVHRVTLAPRPMEQIMTRTERRWAPWKPWAVAGASAVFFAGAAYFDRRASQEFDRFDSMFRQQCVDGCTDDVVPASWDATWQHAEDQRRIALSGYITGGAVLATGAILVYLNRERVIRFAVDENGAAAITVQPMLSPHGASMGAEVRF